MAIADGPTEVHKITLARQLLKGYKPRRGAVAVGRTCPPCGNGPRRASRRCSSTRSRTTERDRAARLGSMVFDPGRNLSRREALAAFGAAGLAIVVAGCSGGSSSDSASTRDQRSAGTRPGTTAVGSTGSKNQNAPGTTCTLAPEVTQGPFYRTDHPNTSNLVQDRPGRPLAVPTLTVVDTKCTLVTGAKVDVWHCDAAGVYGGIGNGTGGGGGPGGGGPGGGDFGAALARHAGHLAAGVPDDRRRRLRALRERSIPAGIPALPCTST